MLPGVPGGVEDDSSTLYPHNSRIITVQDVLSFPVDRLKAHSPANHASPILYASTKNSGDFAL